MIDKKYRSTELIGRKCRPVHDIVNGGGQGVSKGTICTIVAAHYGVTIQTERCPCCGQFAVISRVDRRELDLID